MDLCAARKICVVLAVIQSNKSATKFCLTFQNRPLMFGRGVLDSNIRNIPLSSQKKKKISSSNLWDFFSLIWDFFAVLCQAFALSRSVPGLHLTRIARTGLGKQNVFFLCYLSYVVGVQGECCCCCWGRGWRNSCFV